MPPRDQGRAMLNQMREEMLEEAGVGSSSSTTSPSILADDSRRVAQMTSLGMSAPEIMLQLGLSLPTLSSILSSPDFRALVRSFLPPAPSPEEVRGLFLDEVEKSVSKVAFLRDHSQSDKVQLSAARDILDRAGFTPIRRVASISYHLPRDKAGLIGETLKDLVVRRGEGE